MTPPKLSERAQRARHKKARGGEWSGRLMAINAYFQDELNYLRDLGQEFANENPRLAPFLARAGDDPDVERLLEGFAFLTARLRQRLNEDLPELAHNLLQLVWPHYLRAIPPFTILRFDPAEGAGARAPKVPRGITVQSRPISGVSCQFRTAYDVNPLPLSVSAVEVESRATTGRLIVTFSVADRANLQRLTETPLTLFLNGDRDDTAPRALYLWLLRHLRSVTASVGGRTVRLGREAVRPRGFRRSDALLDYPANAFDGFRIVQEYLAYPAKFMFLDVVGLDELASASGDLKLVFDLDRPLPAEVRITETSVMLNCTPASNLFDHDAQPITVDQSLSEYRVVPVGGSQHYSISSIRTVSGWSRGGGRRIEYAPFETFRHDQPQERSRPRYYRTRIRPAVVRSGVDHYLSFLTRLDQVGRPDVETVSVGLTCSNGPLAERLPIGSIDQPTALTPANLTFTNVAGVAGEVPPPAEDDLLWRLIANLARNFGSLVDADALRITLSAYDFRAVADAQSRRRLDLLLEGIVDFEQRGIDILLQGRPVRGREIVLDVMESKLGGEPEMFLFGSVLDAFFSAYASVNSLHRFALSGLEAKTESGRAVVARVLSERRRRPPSGRPFELRFR
ncbi:MAG: type VI secretion system baseplate subunit TssF, partial [Pseudomonadota bacterium]